MRTFTATNPQPNTIPWECWDDEEMTKTRPLVWGESLVPWPYYESYGDFGVGVGEPLGVMWQALLPADFPLPSWITEVL